MMLVYWYRFGNNVRSSHKKLESLAKRLVLDDNTRGELESMRKDVFRQIAIRLKQLDPKDNPWRLSRSEELRTGSLVRGTAMMDSSDVDVVLLLNFHAKQDRGSMPRANDVLFLIKSLIPEGYQATLNKRSVRVQKSTPTGNPMRKWHSNLFNEREKLSMDVVPALRKVAEGPKQSPWWYGISKTTNSGSWIRFNPKTQKDMFRKLGRRKGQLDDPTVVIIALKHWRNRFRNPPRKLPSYVLEVLTWRDYKLNPHPEHDLTVRFNRILLSMELAQSGGVRFDEMVGGAHKPPGKKVAKGELLIHDPSNTSHNLIHHFARADYAWWSKRAKEAAGSHTTFEAVLGEWKF